jgi:hypothetical protein
MDVNKILTPVMVRLLDDKNIPGETTLAELLNNTVNVIKGPRKPTNATNPCFTIHVLSAPRDPYSKNHNGTLLINFYYDNYQSGNAAVEKMGPVADRVVCLFDDKPLNIEGYNNYNLVVQEPLGPLFDPEFPGEHYMSIRVKFSIVKLR